MKQVTITVSNEVANKLVQLAKTGRVAPSRRKGQSRNSGYLAYQLLTQHAQPVTRDFVREITIDGVTYVAPATLSYDEGDR